MAHIVIKKYKGKIYGYIVNSYSKDGHRVREYIRRATQEEIETHQNAIKINKKLVPVVCTYPHCNKIFKITKNQKQKFYTTFPLRYGNFTLPYCSAECRNKHLKELEKLQKQSAPKTGKS